jgi:Protein of unknown function with HXXEE motif
MHLPLIFSFWFTVAAYVVHVLDESLLGGSFVAKIQQHWWPEYTWRKFFWFNAAYFLLMIASVVAYDCRGGAWVILPLAWVIERAVNGVWHLWWAIHFHEYSPGLVTSILMWMNLYFVALPSGSGADSHSGYDFCPSDRLGSGTISFALYSRRERQGQSTRQSSFSQSSLKRLAWEVACRAVVLANFQPTTQSVTFCSILNDSGGSWQSPRSCRLL